MHVAIDLLYFAGVREAIGRSGERVNPPAAVRSVADLMSWLAERGANYGAAFADRGRLRAAIDNRFVDLSASIVGASEVALFPPVTGGNRMSALRVVAQREDFDVGAELARLEALGGGGIASFIGIVRGEGGMDMLELEHHPGMTENVMRGIAEQAAERWSLAGATVIHRYGELRAGERIVLAATAARHRHAALDACSFLIDWLKTEAPFWKKEHFADGRSAWVEPRTSDAAATDRWRA